jgi:hypothetical protein
MAYNLSSPNRILERCDLTDLEGWFARELVQISNPSVRRILQIVANDLESFVQWASEPVLFWPGCNRVSKSEKKEVYFSYPPHLKQLAESQGIHLDTRANGPAIASFSLAAGNRPKRFGSSNAWSLHHLYSGKFPYLGRESTVHAVKECNHFTQSAGVVAIHPIADALFDEFPIFAWFLRAHAYLRFAYDPDQVFSSDCDAYGFPSGKGCRIIEVPSE